MLNRINEIADGLVDFPSWKAAGLSPRILWLLKEPNTHNDPGNSMWSLAGELRKRAEAGTLTMRGEARNYYMGNTFGLVAKTSWVLTQWGLHQDIPDQLAVCPDACRSLKNIAVVNVEPTAGGGPSASESHIKSKARSREGAIRRRILEGFGPKPDIVIGGNTLDGFQRDSGMHVRAPRRKDPIESHFPVRVDRENRIVWINAFHPNFRGVFKHGIYIDKVRRAWLAGLQELA